MDRSTVWAAMTAAFGRSEGDLVDRLLDALDALKRRVAMPADVNPLPSWCCPTGKGIRASTSGSRIRRIRYRSCDGS
jgi:hypothetical protein